MRLSGTLPGRLAILSRVCAAVAGGYTLAALSAAWLSLVLPLSRVEATVAGTLISIAVYVVAIMWAFAAATARRAWLGVMAPAAVLLTLILLTQRV